MANKNMMNGHGLNKTREPIRERIQELIIFKLQYKPVGGGHNE